MIDEIAIYSVYDENADKYDVPFFAANDLFAQRRFIMLSEDPQNLMHRFIDEFRLVRLGFVNVVTGDIRIEKKIVKYGKHLKMQSGGFENV